MADHNAESAQATGLDEQVSKDEEPGHQGLQSQGPDRPSPPVTNIQQLVNAFAEIGRQVVDNGDIGTEGFHRILRTALSSLRERFSGAYTLSRPYIMWEILVHIEEELSSLYGIPIWATTTLPQPNPWDEPISGKAHASLEKLLEFSTTDTMFHNIKEWCMTGCVADLGIEAHEPYEPQDPEPTEVENKKPAKSAGGQKRKQQQKKKPAEPTRGQKKKPAEPTRGQDKKPAQSESSPELTETTRGRDKTPTQPETSPESTEPTRGRLTVSDDTIFTGQGVPFPNIDREEEEELQMAIRLSLQEAESVRSNRQPATASSSSRSTRQQLSYPDWRPDPGQTPVPTGYMPGREMRHAPRRSRARTPTGYTPPPETRESSPEPEETCQVKKRRLD